ncbi:MAG: pyridoxal phosphate-dependent aminotransferase [Planctomycetes bacterium]|nr:pyridoxal phosphate-dependent aminotransferase [Planctomycetota bacterium]
MKLASRMSLLGTETAFEVLARARALEAKGRNIVHLEIGEPDFDTPAHIIDEGVRALRHGFTHYGPSPGLPQLREAICEHVTKTRGIACKPENVVVTPGGKPIMFFAMLALVEPGDEVLYPNPGFPIYESMIKFAGGTPVPLRLVEEKGFSLDLDMVESRLSSKTKMIVLNSPQNPTGGTLTKDDVAQLAALLRKFPDVIVLSDEIYSDLVYDGEHHSILRHEGFPERTILLDGFSKTFAMTGWRLGYGVMPADLAAQVARLQTNATSCTASFTQMAGVAALRGDWGPIRAMVEEFHRRRDLIVDGLNSIPGFTCVKPRGAFYVFPNITGTGIPAKVLQQRLLEEAGVACLAGTAFGEWGEGYLRFSYANSTENILEALHRVHTLIG